MFKAESSKGRLRLKGQFSNLNCLKHLKKAEGQISNVKQTETNQKRQSAKGSFLSGNKKDGQLSLERLGGLDVMYAFLIRFSDNNSFPI